MIKLNITRQARKNFFQNNVPFWDVVSEELKNLIELERVEITRSCYYEGADWLDAVEYAESHPVSYTLV